MRHLTIRQVLSVTGLALGLWVPALAHAQAPVPTSQVPRLNLRLHLNPATVWQPAATVTAPADAREAPRTPRVKPNGPVFIRAFGGFIAGETSVTVTGFLVGGGVALPLGPREAMELQVDLSFTRYTGGSEYHSFDMTDTTDYEGRVIAPTALFIFNFVQDGRKVVPFIGGGLIFAHVAETSTVHGRLARLPQSFRFHV